MTTLKRVKKVYGTLTLELKAECQKQYLEMWHLGYDSTLIHKQIAKRHFKGYTRIVQIIEARKLTKGLKRNCSSLDHIVIETQKA
ncbi:MAG: hypothetical protein ACOYO1_02385 [Bacteroidales bacterium]